MNRFLAAAALAMLIATPALAQTVSPPAPESTQQTMAQHRPEAGPEHARRLALHRQHRETLRMRDNSCPADSTNEAGGPTHPGGYCLPGGRS